MYTPDFQSVEDVKQFLRYGGDAWCKPMVEEYMELVALDDVALEAIDIDELNGWIEHEMRSLSDSYESWNDDTA